MKTNNIARTKGIILSLQAFILIMIAACSADEFEYCRKYQCYFSFNLTYHPGTYISNCINSLSSGTFCMVTQEPVNGVRHLKVSMYGKTTEDIAITTAEESRVSCILGCDNGLIIGCSSLNDGSLYAYDLKCPNCLNDGIYKPLQWDNSGNWVKCQKCSRSYDLNNSGYVVKGDSGDKLLRYRASSTGTVLFVGN